MKVILKSSLFTPLGRFKKTQNQRYPDELPDEVRPHLPSSAVIVEEGKHDPLPVPSPHENEPVTLSEFSKQSAGTSALAYHTKPKK